MKIHHNKTESQRRNSLREIKAALRQEKLHNALSYDDTVTTTTTNENGRRRMMDRGGMESVPSYYQSSGVPSFAHNVTSYYALSLVALLYPTCRT